MIDNPLPNQIMQQKQRDFEDESIQRIIAYKEARRNLCSDHDVFTDLI